MNTPRPITVVDLGRRDYHETLELQRRLCREKVEGLRQEDLLLIVEHPPVVTLGRGTEPTSLPIPPEVLRDRGMDVIDVERGGDVTLHAPGQMVGYPIFDLNRFRLDLHWYLRQLEQVLIGALGTVGIKGSRQEGLTGVWVANRKIASIGVHVKRWVTLHGFALNVRTDLAMFGLIVPCGIPDVQMTSIVWERPSTEGTDLWQSTYRAVVDSMGSVFEHKIVRAPESCLAPIPRA